jgi:hypothetical protein
VVGLRGASARSGASREWVAERGGDPARVQAMELDLDDEAAPLDLSSLGSVRDVFHLTALRLRAVAGQGEAHQGRGQPAAARGERGAASLAAVRDDQRGSGGRVARRSGYGHHDAAR